MKPSDFMNSPFDSKLENELKKQLKNLPEIVRLNFIKECFEYNKPKYPKLLKVAISCISNHEYVKEILIIGLKIADASRIQYWVELGVKKLGELKYIKFLKNNVSEFPLSVDKSIYWLPRYINRDNEKVNAEFNALKKALKDNKEES